MIGKKIMAVCDTEGEYACRLMEYLEEKRSLPYEIHAFTSADTLCEFAAGKEIGLLLVSEEAFGEQVQQIGAEHRVILTEEEERETEEELRICKYQPACSIMQRILLYIRGGGLPGPRRQRSGERQVIGVYAPAGGSEAALFAAALGQVLAEQTGVLYLSLRPFSGMEMLSGEIFERTASDLLYYYHRDENSLREKLPGVIRQLGALNYIPPSLSPADLQEISGEEWAAFLERLTEANPLDILLLEFSDSIRDLPDLLALCEKIYLPVPRDALGKAAAAEFLDGLRSAGRADLRRRITEVHPPRPGQGEEALLLASSGEAGRYVRQILAEGGERHGSAAGTERTADGAPRRKRRAFRRRDPGDHR